MKASECKCAECGKQAVAFFPVFDPDIPSYPYCRECLDKFKRELMMKLCEVDAKYKHGKDNKKGRNTHEAD